jgi:hypothetical protein
MLTELLKKIVVELDKLGIPYMLSGSIAMNEYTIPRMTRDIDIVIELREDNIDAFVSIFDDTFYLDKDTVLEETKRRGMFNAIDQTSGYKIDFIVRKNTEYRRLEFSRKQKHRIEDFDVWIVAPEDLIISKVEWIQVFQSDRQTDDIQNLVDSGKADLKYVKNWCSKLNLKTFNLI